VETEGPALKCLVSFLEFHSFQDCLRCCSRWHQTTDGFLSLVRVWMGYSVIGGGNKMTCLLQVSPLDGSSASWLLMIINSWLANRGPWCWQRKFCCLSTQGGKSMRVMECPSKSTFPAKCACQLTPTESLVAFAYSSEE
jgi:hypothetical protein